MKRLWWQFLQPWWALRREDFFNWTTLNLFLFLVALLLLLVWLTPPAADCLIPPHAPTRGFYQHCWTFWELWA